MNITEILIF